MTDWLIRNALLVDEVRRHGDLRIRNGRIDKIDAEIAARPGERVFEANGRIVMPGVIDRLCDARLAFLRGLSTWATFGKGWASRVESVRKAAREMAAGTEMPAPIVPPTIYMQPKAKAAEKAMVKAALASDGSRTIGVGERVAFRVAPGRMGRWEATDLRPADAGG